MNHAIIKKALNEALTQKYYDELMECDDEEHIFGVGFSADMKRLIRKTDDKLLYYSKYAAIAACACIAIGCAVLLPNLINSGIRTEPVITTPAIESDRETGTIPDETTLPIIITTTKDTTTVMVTTTPQETTTPDDTTVPPVTTTEVTTTPHVTTTESKGTTETQISVDDADADGDVIVDDDADDSDAQGDPVIDGDTEGPPVSEEDDDVEIEDDTESEDDVVLEDDSDDTVVEDDDCDLDVDDDIEEDDVIEEDEVVEDEDDTPLQNITAGTLGGAIGELLFDDVSTEINDRIYTNKLIYMKSHGDGASSLYNLYATRENLDFVTEFILKNKDNPVPAEAREEDYWNDHLIIEISDAPSGNLSFHDYSSRNNYEGYFGETDVEVEEDEIADLFNTITLTVYQGGVIGVRKYGYSTAYYEADTSELFKKLEEAGFSNTPKTVNDVISDFGITADNIYKAYGSVRNFYDVNIINARFDTESDKAMLVSFLEKIKDKKLTAHTGSINEFDSCNFIITFNEPFKAISIRAYQGKLYFADRSEPSTKWYSTPITQSELEELIAIACKAENLADPVFFETFDEYLDVVKHLTRFENVSYPEYLPGETRYYTIEGEEKLAAFFEFFQSECKSAEYMPYAEYGNGTKSFFADVNGYNPMLFNDADEIRIAGNIFQCSDGMYGRITDYIKQNSTVKSEQYDDTVVEIDDELAEDDVVYEDEIEIEE